MLRTVSHLSATWTAMRPSVRQLCRQSSSAFHGTTILKDKNVPHASAHSDRYVDAAQVHRSDSAAGGALRNSSSSSNSSDICSNSSNDTNSCKSSALFVPLRDDRVSRVSSDESMHTCDDTNDSCTPFGIHEVSSTHCGMLGLPNAHHDHRQRETTDAHSDVMSSTRKVRSALRTLAEMEQIKSRKSSAVQSNAPSDTKETTSVPLPSEATLGDSEHTPDLSTQASSSMQASNATTSARTNAAPAVLGKLSWIRNKRAKFWATVHPSSTHTHKQPAHSVSTIGVPTGSGCANTAQSRAGHSHSRSSHPRTANDTLDTHQQTNLSLASREEDKEDSQQDRCIPLHTRSRVTQTCDGTNFSSEPTRMGSAEDGAPAMQKLFMWSETERIDSAPPQQKLPSEYKTDVARSLAELLNRDVLFGPVLLEMLPADSRRLMLVMGMASEYFGEDYTDVIEQIKEADRDGDDSISANDYDEWARSSFMHRRQQQQEQHQQSEQRARHAQSHETDSARSGRGAGSDTVPGARARSAASSTPSLLSQASNMPSDRHSVQSFVNSSLVKAIQHNLCMANYTPSSSPALPARPSNLGTSWQRVKAALLTLLFGANHRSKAYCQARGPSAEAAAASYIPWNLYLRLLFASAAPFLAFGMLDNATLVLAGDATNRYLAEAYGFSAMTSAGFGGVVSGVAGIQVHGLAERCTRAAPPVLTAAQQRSSAYERSSRTGNTMGMVVGLILGMLPLLFLDHSNEKQLQEDNDCLRREAARHRERYMKRQKQKEKEHVQPIATDHELDCASE